MIEIHTGVKLDKDHKLRIRKTLLALKNEGLQGRKISLCRHSCNISYLLRVKCSLRLDRERNWRKEVRDTSFFWISENLQTPSQDDNFGYPQIPRSIKLLIKVSCNASFCLPPWHRLILRPFTERVLSQRAVSWHLPWYAWMLGSRTVYQRCFHEFRSPCESFFVLFMT